FRPLQLRRAERHTQSLLRRIEYQRRGGRRVPKGIEGLARSPAGSKVDEARSVPEVVDHQRAKDLRVQRLSHFDRQEMLGSVRPTVSVALSRLQKAGIIETS